MRSRDQKVGFLQTTNLSTNIANMQLINLNQIVYRPVGHLLDVNIFMDQSTRFNPQSNITLSLLNGNIGIPT